MRNLFVVRTSASRCDVLRAVVEPLHASVAGDAPGETVDKREGNQAILERASDAAFNVAANVMASMEG